VFFQGFEIETILFFETKDGNLSDLALFLTSKEVLFSECVKSHDNLCKGIKRQRGGRKKATIAMTTAGKTKRNACKLKVSVNCTCVC